MSTPGEFRRAPSQLLLAVLVDDNTGTSAVLALEPSQAAAIRTLLPMRKETWRAVHDWLRSLDLDDNEVLGSTRNEFIVALNDRSPAE
jgi:hypothetical protein